MRVLHIINNLIFGGAEKMLVEMIPAQIEKIDVKVLLLDGSLTPLHQQLISKIGSENIIILSKKSLYNPLFIFRIAPYLKEYDVVHVHLFPALYYTSAAAMIFGKKAKLIFTEHSTTNKRINSILFKRIDKLIYKQYNAIIAITPEVQTMLENNKLANSENIQVVYNGIDLSKIEFATGYNKREYFEDENAIILIQVALFKDEKDQKTVIKSLLKLPKYVKLLLVGDGIHRKECEKLVHDLKLEKRISFLGLRSDVPQLLKTADIVIQASFFEGFGLAALEGMAAKKPVIGSDVPGLAGVLENAGLLFDTRDADAIAGHVKSLIEDKNYYLSVSEKCYERAQLYSIKNTSDQLIKVYEKA